MFGLVWWSGLVTLKNGKNDRAMNEWIWNGGIEVLREREGIESDCNSTGIIWISAIGICNSALRIDVKEEGCGGTIAEHKGCGFDDRTFFF